MALKARAISLLLTLGAGLLSPPAAFGEPSKTGATEVRVSKPPSRLKRTRYTAPRYPHKALQARVSGFVTIEFVINTRGEPTGLRVLDAYPAEIFEHAVLSAAKRWRYKPLVVDNTLAEQPTRTVVHFQTRT